jgi:restriction system protein
MGSTQTHMGPAIIVAQLFIGLAIFAFGFLVGFAIKSSYQHSIWTSQNRGEASVHRIITANFPPPQYHLLNNITIPFKDGTTQIDHILVSTKGIFVIETKNYSGWIFGDENSKQWTQVLYKVKSRFQNPIHQNFLHIKVVEQLLDFLPKEQIHSVVVFTGSAQFKTAVPKGVIFPSQLTIFLKGYQEDTISINRVEFCVGRLECKRYEVTKMTDLQHRAYLAQKLDKSGD